MKFRTFTLIWLLAGISLVPVDLAVCGDISPLEGFGARSRGGDGGVVIKVTNLNDSGAGSLRAALSNRPFPRRVVFDVEGVISLNSRIRVNHGRVTIDGFSAPGNGITLLNHGLYFKGDCDDIIIHNMRIRVTRGGEAGDGITFLATEGNSIERVMVDHCSILWATDEAFDTWGSVRDLTCQWTILAEGQVDGDHPKGAHGMGWLSGPETDRVTIHHCLFAHNGDRNPKVQGGTYEVVNNVIYNWSGLNAMKVKNGAHIDVIGNSFLPGPDSSGHTGCIVIEDPVLSDAASRLYVSRNCGPFDTFWENVNWFEKTSRGSKRHRPAPISFRETETFSRSHIKAQSAEQSYESVLSKAGPRVRDGNENRIIKEVRERTGRIGKPLNQD